VERVTGKPLGHADLISYLLAKMEPLYSAAPPAEAPAPLPAASEAASEPSPQTMAIVAAMAAAAEGRANGEAAVAAEAGEDSALGTAAPAEHAASESLAATATSEEAPAEQETVATGGALSPPEATAEADPAFNVSTLQTTPRQQPYEMGMVGNLIGIVVFGFVGLAMGYWLLNFFGGEQFNFLDIWLPFVTRQ
jgi:hypothetical protein